MARKYALYLPYKVIDSLSGGNVTDSQFKEFIMGLVEYDKSGIFPASPTAGFSMMYELVKSDLDFAKAKYDDVVRKRSEAGKQGGAPKNNKNALKKNKQNNQKQAKQAKQADNRYKITDNSKQIKENRSQKTDKIPCDSNEPPDKETTSKHETKLPLRDREPKNEYEKVEKVYLQNWDTLYSENKVKTPNPVMNLGGIRSTLDTRFKSLSPEIIIQAINNGMKDKWIIENGYSLGMMLSANILNRLINGGESIPRENSKRTLSGLSSTFNHSIANDNIPPEEVEKYFRSE